jgi:DNA-directed RNA polymerase sigma subunit (sigma70/sigma32)
MHHVHLRPASLDQRRADGTSPVLQPAATTVAVPVERGNQQEAIADLLKDLSPFERAAVEMRFGLHGAEPQSVDTIANSLDHTRRETREALRIAMAKLSRKGRSLRMNERGYREADGSDDGLSDASGAFE